MRRQYSSDSDTNKIDQPNAILRIKPSFTYTDDHMGIDDNDDEELYVFYECYDISRIDQKDIVTNISNTICYNNDMQNTNILDKDMKLDNIIDDTTIILKNNIVVIDETCNNITVTHIVDNSIHDIDIIHSKIDNNDECLIISYRYDVKDIHYMYKYIQHIFTSLSCETKFNVIVFYNFGKSQSFLINDTELYFMYNYDDPILSIMRAHIDKVHDVTKNNINIYNDRLYIRI